ncbi:MAG TPA: hypothetical protein VJ436_01390 [Anaerolineales bacterium]|nr:hypothetical protein [Anaerolineales bacterium]
MKYFDEETRKKGIQEKEKFIDLQVSKYSAANYANVSPFLLKNFAPLAPFADFFTSFTIAANWEIRPGRLGPPLGLAPAFHIPPGPESIQQQL